MIPYLLRMASRHRGVAALLVASLCAGSATAAAPIPPEAVANQFWSTFRKVVRDKDGVGLVQLVNFPFVVRWGNADPNDPRVTVDRRRFPEALDHLLKLRINPTAQDGRTVADLVVDTVQIPASDAASGEFMVGTFEFRRVRGAWRWTAAFTDDAFFFPQSASDEIPRISPLRKPILDALTVALDLKRPLKVLHIKRAADVVYVEAQEPGPAGRVARAVLTKEPNDAKGRMVWSVKERSFRQAGDDSAWRGKVAGMIKAGTPASLFPAALTTEER